MAPPEGIGLAAFNALPHAEVVEALLTCCSSAAWAAHVAGRRPYLEIPELHDAADDALAAMTDTDLDEALDGHPRIGERPASSHSAWSSQEQSGVAGAADQVQAELAVANREYEERFGHVYLVCATGRSAGELLAILRERLGNDPVTERQVMRAELGKINRIRLDRLIGPPENGAFVSTVTTHVLDTSRGKPAPGVPVALEDTSGKRIGSGATDADGRIRDLGPDDLPSGTYRLVFHTAAYLGDDTFYPEVTVTFHVTAGEHHHVPLLLSGHGYTTYRGS